MEESHYAYVISLVELHGSGKGVTTTNLLVVEDIPGVKMAEVLEDHIGRFLYGRYDDKLPKKGWHLHRSGNGFLYAHLDCRAKFEIELFEIL